MAAKRSFDELSLYERERRSMDQMHRLLMRLPKDSRSRVLEFLLRTQEEELPLPPEPPGESDANLPLFEGP